MGWGSGKGGFGGKKQISEGEPSIMLGSLFQAVTGMAVPTTNNHVMKEQSHVRSRRYRRTQ